MDLNEEIHQYHNKDQKGLYKTYILNTNNPPVVISALKNNILKPEKDLYKKISPLCSIFKDN